MRESEPTRRDVMAAVNFRCLEGVDLSPYPDRASTATRSEVCACGCARSLRIGAVAERFVCEFGEDGAMLSGSWERAEDGRRWLPWKDVVLTKVKP